MAQKAQLQLKELGSKLETLPSSKDALIKLLKVPIFLLIFSFLPQLKIFNFLFLFILLLLLLLLLCCLYPLLSIWPLLVAKEKNSGNSIF